MSDLVLVTGASGYVATHTVQQLIKAGYRVRGTVRSLSNEEKVKPIRALGEGGSLELVEADLCKEEGWDKAVEGCTYVLHIASPFPTENPRDENELIKPAVDGTLNVLKACRAAKTVKSVVLTSSTASINGTKGRKSTEPYTEENWTDPDNCISAYMKSKTLAEKAAWDFVKDLPEDEKFALAVINPAFVLGPTLCGTAGTSMQVMRRVIDRQMPMLPNVCFPVADVRDVAAAHIVAMTTPEAWGHRHIICSESKWFTEIGEILAKEFKSQGYNPPTKKAPYPLLWVISRFDKSVRMILPEVNQHVQVNNARFREVLKIEPISAEKTIIDMAYSMIDQGQAKKTSKYRPRDGKTQQNGAAQESQPTQNGQAASEAQPTEEAQPVKEVEPTVAPPAPEAQAVQEAQPAQQAQEAQ